MGYQKLNIPAEDRGILSGYNINENVLDLTGISAWT